jgi:outer membrane protein assembly factor BamB
LPFSFFIFPSSSDNWPQFRGNPQLTGVSLSTLPETLKVVWTYEAGDAIESSAAIADGVVYLASQKGELVALNLQDGAVRWKYSTGEGVGESSPCVGSGVVYIGDLSGTFHAVNLLRAKPWTSLKPSEIQISPVLVGDRY